MTKILAAGSVLGLGLAGVLVPASAVTQGTSDTVITCEGAHSYDPENYNKPGFVCEVDPDWVKVDGTEYSVVRYTLVIRKGKKQIVESKSFEYGLDPAPVFFQSKKLKANTRYNVDYKAVIDAGSVVTVSDDDFFLKTPPAPGRPGLKVKFGKLQKGVGTGYVLTWPKAKHADGYAAQVKAKGGWKKLPLSGARSAEFGKVSKTAGISFRVRSWNAGGKSAWSTG